jgi:ligand-binding SRPBCC domain-containing protein
VPTIELVTPVAAPVGRCFELSLSVDAHQASMAKSGEHVVCGVTSGSMSLGDTVTWRARHFGIPVTMTSEITEYDAPRRFVDEQVSGPFRVWWHEHTFEPEAGGTRMRDRVVFESPGWIIGWGVNRLLLTAYMTSLLEQRNAWLAKTLEAEPPVQ